MTSRDRSKPGCAEREDEFIFTPGSWLDPLPLVDMFGRDAPLEVDVGCGKGRFLARRATQFPDHNFLGIDRRMVRLRKVEGKLRRGGLRNVRLLHLEAGYSVKYLLPAQAVDVFYIFFPDPWPKRRHHTRRLLQEQFIDDLLSALNTGGHIHLATDHQDYFQNALALLGEHDDLTQVETFEPSDDEQTEFEQIFLSQGLPIGRCSFRKSTSR